LTFRTAAGALDHRSSPRRLGLLLALTPERAPSTPLTFAAASERTVHELEEPRRSDRSLGFSDTSNVDDSRLPPRRIRRTVAPPGGRGTQGKDGLQARLSRRPGRCRAQMLASSMWSVREPPSARVGVPHLGPVAPPLLRARQGWHSGIGGRLRTRARGGEPWQSSRSPDHPRQGRDSDR
jgi:hypothetical protein